MTPGDLVIQPNDGHVAVYLGQFPGSTGKAYDWTKRLYDGKIGGHRIGSLRSAGFGWSEYGEKMVQAKLHRYRR